MSMFDKLFDEAKAAFDVAYAPYSNFNVGAAILTKDGAIVSGCNVENAAYPEGTCAEAGAIAAMIRQGHKRIAEVVVIGDAALCSPCGGCRQKIKEFADEDVKVHIANLDGLVTTLTVGELLPAGFELHGKK
ncbi:cytidine deaminase [Rhodobacteraceae bacterium RKSG542]|uniref:cytidine deaminase n=1 Tax=Pseudovibrio flavus TaxID=2529854 RepID=UPI0012BC6B82|nr:cytidine deaminase [Pseudovibrio flavus]MTI17211.1 cytidine deaminase [Pseudovibrio flavus]